MQKGKRTSPDPIIPGEKELLLLVRATEFKSKVKERGASLIQEAIRRINFIRQPMAMHIAAVKLSMEDRRERRKQEQIESKKQILAQLKRETNQ